MSHLISAIARFFVALCASGASGGSPTSLVANFRPIGGGAPDADIADRVRDLKAARQSLVDENNRIVESAPTEEIKTVTAKGEQKVVVTKIDDERRARFDENLAKVKSELQPEIERLETLLKANEWGAQPDGPSLAAIAAAAAAAGAQGEQHVGKSLGQLVLDSDEWKAVKDSGAMKKQMTLEVAGFSRKDIYSDFPTGSPGTFGRVQRDPLVPMAFRTFRVRDLFPVVNTDAALIEFFQVIGFNNAASVVPERDGSAFALKPHSNLSVEGRQAAVRTIAHWEVAHRNVLDDEPQLRGIIENELLYGLQLTEDYQILQGTGTGQDLLGILNTPNVQTYAASSETTTNGNKNINSVRHGITLAFLSNYEATGVVLPPTNWEEMEKAEDADGRFLLYAVAGSTGAEPRLWRLPVVVTPAMPDDRALVGSFGLGATLYDRQKSSIRIAEQHDDYFVRNAVVILAEERLALATKRPESFVDITLV